MNKQLAGEIAFNMLKSTRDKIEAKQKELSDFNEKIVLNLIPKEILSAISKLPDGWVEKSNNFYFNSPYGNVGVSVCTTNRLPRKHNEYGIKINKVDFEKVKSLTDEINAMKNKSKQLKEQIVSSLLKLRTLERIKKDFPEAYKHFPKDAMSSNNIIAIPIENILKSINEFPE